MAGKFAFLVLRQRYDTIQAIVAVADGSISKAMVKFASSIPKESIVEVCGVVSAVPTSVQSCSVHSAEIQVDQLYIVSSVTEGLPFQLEDAMRPEIESAASDQQQSHVLLDTRLNNRVIDLRTPANQAIFSVQSAVCQAFRGFLLRMGFTEIHTPKIISAASEGGANVFKISYFKGDAFLAQSPQLYKQMAICSDFPGVFEIAPVFRAENSMTHRHMTEFTGLDLEMPFNEHYHEVMDLIAKAFVAIFDELYASCGKEIALIREQFPEVEEFRYLRKTLVLSFSEAIDLLRNNGYPEAQPFDDLSTEQERVLGRVIKQLHGTDFYVIDKFPLAVRPFYTMPDASRPGYANAYDFFMRGEEILSGAQRVHDYAMLLAKAKEHKIDLATISAYLDSFKYGVPPHAGGGVGLERVVMLFFGLGNIRRTCMFPRDPKRLTP